MAIDGFWVVDTPGTPANMNATLLQYDTLGNRPAAGQKGVHFFATDTFELSRDNGVTWDLLGKVVSTGAQTFAGIKTFSSIPVGPGSNPTTANQLARKQYVDDRTADKSASAYHSTTQSISNNTLTTVALNSEDFDTDTMHHTSTNNERLTFRTAGKYLVTGWVSWAANTNAGYRALFLLFNTGSNNTIQIARNNPAASQSLSNIVTAILDVSINDYIHMKAKQDSSASISLLGGVDNIGLVAFKLR